MPRPIVEKIAADVSRIIAAPAFRQRIFVERAVEPVSETLDEFAGFVRAQRKIAERIVKESGEQPK